MAPSASKDKQGVGRQTVTEHAKNAVPPRTISFHLVASDGIWLTAKGGQVQQRPTARPGNEVAFVAGMSPFIWLSLTCVPVDKTTGDGDAILPRNR
jgi:hypothetical protein